MPAAPLRLRYRSSDGRCWFFFSIEEQPDHTYHIFIEQQPSYGRRSESLHLTHRLEAGSRRYICFTPQPRTIDDAKRIAAAWADHTSTYVSSGLTFEEQRGGTK